MDRNTILIVDDDPLVLTLTRQILQRGGYRVLTASGADEALAVFSEAETTVKLVLSDVRMPGKSGVQLVLRIREIAPETKTMLMSGFAPDHDVPSMPFIPKPFLPRELLATVARELSAHTA